MTSSGDAKSVYIAVATRRFAMDGFHGTSLSNLAKDAGVSKQALLHFFKTKEALYAATLTVLADRMMQDLITCRRVDPVKWLTDYFMILCQNARADSTDLRLVMHALLDSDHNARKWPLKPYLDKLLVIIARTNGGHKMSTAKRINWLLQMNGMINYHIISHTAMLGMYGEQVLADTFNALRSSISAQARLLE